MHATAPVADDMAENPYGGLENAPYGAQPAMAPQSSSNSNPAGRQFACLYTKHKTQKRKIWQDGRLILKGLGAVLHNANPPPGSGDPMLDQCELTGQQSTCILQGNESNLETDKFLITVEGPWSRATTQATAATRKPTLVSNGMKKVLTRKFQKPGSAGSVRPPPLQQQSSVLGKRRMPLQPGELHRRHYDQQPQQQYPPQQQHQQQRSYQQQQPNYPAPAVGRNVQPFRGQQQPPLHQQHPHQQPQHQRPNYPQTNQQNIDRVPDQQSQPSRDRNGQVPFRHQQESPHPSASGFHQQPPPPSNGYPTTNQSAPHREVTPPTDSPGVNHQAPNVMPRQPATVSNTPITTRPPKPKDTGIFANGNGFDPNSFYGEDEEEDDDDASSVGPEASQADWMMGAPSAAPVVQNERAIQQLRPVSKSPAAAAPVEATTSALSNDELLSLFGAASSLVQEPLPPQATEHQASAPADAAVPNEAPDDFVLPSPPDSSSDEDSSQEN